MVWFSVELPGWTLWCFLSSRISAFYTCGLYLIKESSKDVNFHLFWGAGVAHLPVIPSLSVIKTQIKNIFLFSFYLISHFTSTPANIFVFCLFPPKHVKYQIGIILTKITYWDWFQDTLHWSHVHLCVSILLSLPLYVYTVYSNTLTHLYSVLLFSKRKKHNKQTKTN